MTKYLIIALTALLLSGCCRKGLTQQSARLDSVRVVHETKYVERLRDTVIYIQLPAESREIETRCDSSTLETSVALSRARINPDGTLFHNLENKPVKLSTPVVVKDTEQYERQDSIVYRDNYVTDTITVKHIPQSYWWFMGIAILSVGLGLWQIFIAINRRIKINSLK